MSGKWLRRRKALSREKARSRFWRRLRRRLSRSAAIRVWKRIRKVLSRLIAGMFRLVRRSWRLLLRWWKSRNFRLLLQGLPALMAAAAVVLLVGVAYSSSKQVTRQYTHEADRALAANDYPLALTCAQRLAVLDPEQPENIMRLAMAMERMGQGTQATVRVHAIAPETVTGYAPAHVWLARQLMKEPLTEQSRGSIERHLLRALAKQPLMPEANALLAQVYVKTGRAKLAEPYLLHAIDSRPELRIELARVYRSLGRKGEADFHAGVALKFFRQKTQAEVDNEYARLRWSEAAVQLRDFPQAVNALEEGLLLSQSTVIRRALAQVFGNWSDQLADGTMPQFGNRLTLIERGLGYYSSDTGLLQRLLALTRPPKHDAIAFLAISAVGFASSPVGLSSFSSAGPLCLLTRQSTEPGRARAALENLLLKGEVPGVVYFALGLDAWEQGNFTDSRRYLEQAYQQAPEMAVVGNNLAWVLATVEPRDLSRAFQLIDSVVKRHPDNPVFRGTRGHVLTKLKRWKEALPDLVASLKAFSDNPETHAALAETYEQLGFAELAQNHRRLAQKK
jgi:tetratricopeptide (TPR) repeat protein